MSDVGLSSWVSRGLISKYLVPQFLQVCCSSWNPIPRIMYDLVFYPLLSLSLLGLFPRTVNVFTSLHLKHIQSDLDQWKNQWTEMLESVLGLVVAQSSTTECQWASPSLLHSDAGRWFLRLDSHMRLSHATDSVLDVGISSWIGSRICSASSTISQVLVFPHTVHVFTNGLDLKGNSQTGHQTMLCNDW